MISILRDLFTDEVIFSGFIPVYVSSPSWVESSNNCVDYKVTVMHWVVFICIKIGA